MTLPMMLDDTEYPEGYTEADLMAQQLAESMGAPEGASELMEVEEEGEPKEAENLLPLDDSLDGVDPTFLRRSALTGLYGDDFPLAGDEEEPTREKWALWARSLWERHRAPMLRRLWLTERNRKFYKGEQWVTSVGMGPWKEPPKPRDVARRVWNVMKPAIDMRVQILAEQRPGFRTRPTNRDPNKVKRAEAQQVFIEYQYDQQRIDLVQREAAIYAHTDGVSFLHTFWNPDRGPWYEYTGGKRAPLGDMETEVLRIEQVRVSSYASLTRKPHYVVIRKAIPLAEAIRVHGPEVAEEHERSIDSSSWLNESARNTSVDFTGVEESFADQRTVDQYTVYCAPSEYLPEGLQLVVVGAKAIFLGALITECIPVVPVRDGSPDPAYYPAPLMEDWIDDQMTINAVISKWIESIRKNSDGRLMAKPGTIVNETLVGGALSVVEVKTPGSVSEAVSAMPTFSVGGDAKEMLQLAVQSFENKSGWNDAARGSVSSNTSGRAILAIREQLERIFAPGVSAMAEAMTEWAKISLHWARWGYDLPRLIGVTGTSRNDLAREVTSEDFDGVADVEIDPETLMPLPRPLRLFLLDNLLEKGGMDMAEYRKRMPFAFVQNLETPDTIQYARAKRVADAIKQGSQPPAMRWQDNESIHQTVLDEEIILTDEYPEEIVQAAMQRWTELAGQAGQKSGAVAPQGANGAPGGAGQGGGAPAPQGGAQGLQIDPNQAPLFYQNGPVASAPAETLAAGSDPQIAAMQFEQVATQ